MRTRVINNKIVDFDCLPTDIIYYILLFFFLQCSHYTTYLYYAYLLYTTRACLQRTYYLCNLSRRTSIFSKRLIILFIARV